MDVGIIHREFERCRQKKNKCLNSKNAANQRDDSPGGGVSVASLLLSNLLSIKGLYDDFASNITC
jgi:hypothetical protein